MILLCEKSRCVMVLLLMRPPISWRNRSSSIRFEGRTSVVSTSVALMHCLSSPRLISSFQSRRDRNACGPATSYVSSSLLRLGSREKMC